MDAVRPGFEVRRQIGQRYVGPIGVNGIAVVVGRCSLRWLGPRFFFWPQGIPRRHRVSIVSSRLKQRLDEETWWFDLLRTATLRSDPTHDVLCAVAGTAAHRFVFARLQLFGRSVLEFQVDAREQLSVTPISLHGSLKLQSCDVGFIGDHH